MSGNSFGKSFVVTTFGESHGVALGCIIDGCPPGLEIKAEDIQKDLDKRKPGSSKYTTQRKEDDSVEILSGVFEGKTTGTPIALIIKNKDQKSKDYDKLKDVFRPSHADYTYTKKYGFRDHRGGGRSSARETTMRVAAGSIAKKYLKELVGIDIKGYLSQIGNIKIKKIDLSEVDNNNSLLKKFENQNTSKITGVKNIYNTYYNNTKNTKPFITKFEKQTIKI